MYRTDVGIFVAAAAAVGNYEPMSFLLVATWRSGLCYSLGVRTVLLLR